MVLNRMQIPESCGSTASGRAAPSLGMPGQEGWHPNPSCATEASFPNTGTAGVPTEGLGFISEPGEVRGVWAWGWLLSLLSLVFPWLGAAQMLLARAEGSSPASLALLSPHPRLFQDHRSIPHHTALSKVVSPALAALFLVLRTRNAGGVPGGAQGTNPGRGLLPSGRAGCGAGRRRGGFTVESQPRNLCSWV